jgi:hypothetical protein
VTTAKPCTGLSRTRTCLQRLADGWIGHEDLCPRCTKLFMAGLKQASPEPLTWHPNFAARAGEVR